MRLQLHLNQYYDGLDDYQVNHLFGLFMDMKPRIIAFKKTKEAKRTGESYELSKDLLFAGFNAIDVFMKSINKEPLFNTENILIKYNTDESFYDEFDIMPLINKYEYLMEEL